jgi:hypothetical protein
MLEFHRSFQMRRRDSNPCIGELLFPDTGVIIPRSVLHEGGIDGCKQCIFNAIADKSAEAQYHTRYRPSRKVALSISRRSTRCLRLIR